MPLVVQALPAFDNLPSATYFQTSASAARLNMFLSPSRRSDKRPMKPMTSPITSDETPHPESRFFLFSSLGPRLRSGRCLLRRAHPGQETAQQHHADHLLTPRVSSFLPLHARRCRLRSGSHARHRSRPHVRAHGLQGRWGLSHTKGGSSGEIYFNVSIGGDVD
jgi:hypothetical protein